MLSVTVRFRFAMIPVGALIALHLAVAATNPNHNQSQHGNLGGSRRHKMLNYNDSTSDHGYYSNMIQEKTIYDGRQAGYSSSKVVYRYGNSTSETAREAKYLDNRVDIWEEKPRSALNDRYSKFFGLFTMVHFANIECESSAKYGFCVTALECSNFGGTSIGSCARGFGTCCYKVISGSGSSRMNVTTIQNPDYPSATGAGTYKQQIYRQENVCQLRLDFTAFELYKPTESTAKTTSGKCSNDKMTVSNVVVSNMQYLCGKMPTVWHFYVDVRDVDIGSPNIFEFYLDSSVTQSRYWSIRVTQVSCDMRIPQGCGQYFTGSSGDDLYSFNYDNGSPLYGFTYAICFRREKNYCTYSFTYQDNPWFPCKDMLVFQSAPYEDGIPTTDGEYATDIRHCNLVTLSTKWRSTITTNNNGPTYVYYYSAENNALRSTEPSGYNSGFRFKWVANANSC